MHNSQNLSGHFTPIFCNSHTFNVHVFPVMKLFFKKSIDFFGMDSYVMFTFRMF